MHMFPQFVYVLLYLHNVFLQLCVNTHIFTYALMRTFNCQLSVSEQFLCLCCVFSWQIKDGRCGFGLDVT